MLKILVAPLGLNLDLRKEILFFHLNSGEKISYNLFDTEFGDRESILKSTVGLSDQLYIDIDLVEFNK
ncbi:enterotoxin [Streptococcus pyogenes]|nr:enterotoxin [Streptococcus pyogenes]VGR85707.1 enterotoxin [Streptococcus pyogenes]VHE74155.1 enterotoxin [Streptococcus pyogenes]VHF72130.1 enterotoxin [Streptococcus pyogenes]VHH21089.1 enterotoxin [Streptococcus pyogenes]